MSLCHTIAYAKQYIETVNHDGVRHINGDVCHMQEEESHIGSAMLDAVYMLTNLHITESNSRALGNGSLDLDTIIMTLYLVGYNNDACYLTPEPLGSCGVVYRARYSRPPEEKLYALVKISVSYFREREGVRNLK